MENNEQLNDVEEARALLDAHLGDTLEQELSAADLADAALEMPEHMLEDVIETLPHEKIVEAI